MYRIPVFTILFCTSACTWQGTLHTLASTPAELRLSDKTEASNSARFQLERGSAIRLMEAPGYEVQTAAAQRGLDRVFPGSGRSGQYQLRVLWPELPPEYEHRVVRFLDAATPRPARTAMLEVALFDANGAFVLASQVTISPKLWGRDWSTREVLEAGFEAFASELMHR